MHTVIISECTGCDLCVEPCPVDCIDMLPGETTVQGWSWALPTPSDDIIATDAQPGVAA
jgi:electron transport complex protein RnfB